MAQIYLSLYSILSNYFLNFIFYTTGIPVDLRFHAAKAY